MLKKALFILLFLLASASATISVHVTSLDNIYDKTAVLNNWERNSTYVLQVRLYNNNSTAQAFNRVEANCDFDAAHFDLISKTDHISSWTATNFFVVDNGHIQYQRAANNGEANINIPANSYRTIYELVLKVKPTATLMATIFTLDKNFTHVLYNISDLTGNLNNLTVTLVNDITPPVTRVLPGSNLHLNKPTEIVLGIDPNTNCGDLKEIRYTTDGREPSSSSARYTLPITIPANSTVTIKWRGFDNFNNIEDTKTATYRVDTIDPQISNITTIPALPCQLKNGSVITINFMAADNIELSSTAVKIGNNNAAFIKKEGTVFTYRYIINESVDGNKIISITAVDHAQNLQIDTSKELLVDNLAPTFNLISVQPKQANIGNVVILDFSASEELDLTKSKVTLGTNSPMQFVNKNGLNYRFSRTIDGSETSGWLMVTGYDLAGNSGYNLKDNQKIQIYGYDLFDNYGEAFSSFNISY